MPSASPTLTPLGTDALVALGAKIKARRKALRIAAVAAAEAAGVSRVTLHRIEKGEPSVTIGAYLAACTALGLHFEVNANDQPQSATEVDHKGWIPSRVRIADYPVLQQLAWQVHGASELTPREALGIYQRNWRHVDSAKLSPHEQDLVDGLRQALEGEPNV
jgi:transcriptional regulator with XRE-family HTH domain